MHSDYSTGPQKDTCTGFKKYPECSTNILKNIFLNGVITDSYLLKAKVCQQNPVLRPDFVDIL